MSHCSSETEPDTESYSEKSEFESESFDEDDLENEAAPANVIHIESKEDFSVYNPILFKKIYKK